MNLPSQKRVFSRIIGESAAARSLKVLLAKIADSPATTVLLVGESGTGKGLIAQEIHDASRRSARRFETICCSALPETLLESELFGYEAGAFTDARRRKKGLLELADAGTVFLDEIGELSPCLQVKLLHFLEERTCKRLGGTSEVRVDVRVIAATNRDLERAIVEGAFRRDLYYRLNVLPVRVPPLSERTGDIPLLVDYFIAWFNRQLGKSVKGIEAQALAELQSSQWSGNIRELRNFVERAMLLSQADVLTPEDFLPDTSTPSRHRRFELPREGIDLEELEADLMAQALERTDGNQTRAAELLGLTRHQIHYRLQKHGSVPARAGSRAIASSTHRSFAREHGQADRSGPVRLRVPT